MALVEAAFPGYAPGWERDPAKLGIGIALLLVAGAVAWVGLTEGFGGSSSDSTPDPAYALQQRAQRAMRDELDQLVVATFPMDAAEGGRPTGCVTPAAIRARLTSCAVSPQLRALALRLGGTDPAAVQAAPVVAAAQQAAVTTADAGPAEAVADVAAVTAETQVQAAVTVAQPAQVAKAAEVVQQAAGPVVAQAKAVDKGPKLEQAATTVAAAEDATAEVDTAAGTVTTVAAKTATVKEAGPKETRSAAAVDQSQAMARDLGDDTKIQVKVQG